jgi:RNA polymerase sigma-70 factor (ECF subfamily)
MSVNDDRRLDDEVPDARLVERARSGDPVAQGELVRRHHGVAFGVALAVTRDQDTAQDVVQDAFVKAFGALDGFRGDASFKTWLVSITANEAKGALRKRRRRRETGLDEAPELAAAEVDPSEAAVMADEAARARAMLERLPEKQRMSVSLRIDRGLSFRDIGEVIGSSEGAARVNYFHGVRRLRELME